MKSNSSIFPNKNMNSRLTIPYLWNDIYFHEFGIEPPHDYSHSFYTYMLIEDTRNMIVPYSLMSDNKHYIDAITKDEKILQLITYGFDNEYFDDLETNITDFIRQCCHYIMVFEKAIYEIIYFYHPGAVQPTHFKICLVDPRTIVCKLGNYIQNVPKDIARQHNNSTKIKLKEENLIIFQPPSYIKNDLHIIMEKLFFLSSPTPNYNTSRISNSEIPFDSKTYYKNKEMAVLNATNKIGWNARKDRHTSLISEYHWFYRQLLFEEYLIQFRDSILSTINKALNRAGETIGFSSELKFANLSTINDVEQARSNLSQGNSNLKDILLPFRGY